MNKHDEQWKRLTKMARKAPAAPEPEMPYGFATKVVALWPKQSVEPTLEMIWERLTLRVLGIAMAVMLVTLGVTYPSLAEESHGVLSLTDNVIENVIQP